MLALAPEVVRLMPMVEIAERLRNWPRKRTARLAEALDDSLAWPSVQRSEVLRTAAVKVLSILPGGAERLLAWLNIRSPRSVYQVHFSICCFLDAVEGLSSESTGRIAAAVGDYLATTRVGTGSAAWMAADLLGDHLDPAVALPVLIDLLSRARYVAGRSATLHGLVAVMERTSGRDCAEIRKRIRQVARTDRSRAVRRQACMILNRKLQ